MVLTWANLLVPFVKENSHLLAVLTNVLNDTVKLIGHIRTEPGQSALLIRT